MPIRDGDWELFDYDFHTGKSTWRLFDGEKLHFRTDFPVTATIDANARDRADADRAWKGDYHRIASVPMNVFFDKLADANLQHDDKFISRWLNDSDNRAWRTKDGRV